MARNLTRRAFIQQSGAAASVVALPAWAYPANEKVNVGFVGVGGRGGGNLGETAKSGLANVVALCDVDEGRLDQAAAGHPGAKKYVDFRKMIEEGNNIEAVAVSTPDHCHAPAAAMAMKMGKHAYVEKPLTHSVYEARALTELAVKNKVVTQMGNQGHSSDSRRLLVEFLQQGGIGGAKEVHAWTNRPIWPQGLDRPPAKQPPAKLHWDLWLGPAPERPFHDSLHPFAWRGWWDFGTGALGDMACHIMDAAFWGLNLGYPTSVEAVGEPLKPESAPNWMTVTLQFPERNGQPPVKYVWYDGKKGNGKDATPNMPNAELAQGIKLNNNGNIIIGDKGTVVVLDEQTGNWKVVRGGQTIDKKDLEVKQTLARTREHHVEWLEGIRGGPAPLGNFNYSGPFTETVLIGIAAFRAGKKLDWDGKALKAKNTRDADPFIQREYRKGWSL